MCAFVSRSVVQITETVAFSDSVFMRWTFSALTALMLFTGGVVCFYDVLSLVLGVCLTWVIGVLVGG